MKKKNRVFRSLIEVFVMEFPGSINPLSKEQLRYKLNEVETTELSLWYAGSEQYFHYIAFRINESKESHRA